MLQHHPPSKLRCFRCATVPAEFVLLSCYHLLCDNCVSYYRGVQRTPILTVTCACGVQSLLESSTRELIKSSAEERVGLFSIDSTPKIVKEVKVIDSNKKHCLLERADDIIDRTEGSRNKERYKESFQSSMKQSNSVRKGSGERRFIKEIGHFTKSLLNSSECEQSKVNFSKDHNSGSFEFAVNREMRHFELQYEKSIQDLKLALEEKIEEFKRLFREYKRSVKLWYSELQEDCTSFNLAQYSKLKYEPISREFDKLLSRLHSYQLKATTKPTFFSPESIKSKEHRRIRTEIIETFAECAEPQRVTTVEYHSPEFRRHKSREYLCPHAELVLQKRRFIKRKCQMSEPFV